MDAIKYTKIYLERRRGLNKFTMVKIITNKVLTPHTTKSDNIFYHKHYWSHPKVKSGEAFWVRDYELCVGYVLRKNTAIFRPIFSHKRQDLLNEVHLDITNPKKFWDNIKSRYYLELSKISNLPLECVGYIVTFMYQNV